jgi:predicted ATPase/transcriptional regulator with GAF, ATPase, and Fis domain
MDSEPAVTMTMPSATESSEYVLEHLREGPDFTLYRGLQPGNPSPVLVLAPTAEQPSRQGLRRLEHEYSLAAELDPRWAAKPLALTRHEGRTILILTDPGGEPLDLVVERELLGNQGQPLDLTRVLGIAIGLATALGQVHQHGLIHKDIKPENALIDDAGKVWLTGFGIASQLPHECQAPAPPEIIAGTLAYMAPEQTGRMNRSIDARSDLYSLGITLYEIFTGALPFAAANPMEWVHCHIARRPPPPGDRAAVPEPLSAIILKLLAKNAEERYQTASGLETDLRRCLTEWESRGHIDPFPLGTHDVPDRLLIPEKLYGREREIEVLLAAFDRVVAQGTPELVLVSGYSGVGKSSVVNELHKALVPPRGLFASGKFDQYKRDIPYATLAQAFQALIRQILVKSEAEVNEWRHALRDAVGNNGQLVINLIPEVEFIIGKQPPVPDLSPQDAQKRFHLVFRRFLGAFATPEHPLALFLDDLQWLDAATLDLMEDLLTRPDVQRLMLIGAYRDNEVSSTHPLMRKLEAIRQAGAIVHDIVLAPLVREDLRQLVADSIQSEPERVEPLGKLIHDKTAGNPFFAIQFFSALAEESLLTFDFGEGRWSWDLNRIHAKGYTDNVVDLMVAKLNRLPIETQKALQQLACLGNSAGFAMLGMVYQDSNEEMHGQLWEAVRTGLIFRSEDSYRFLHDRVQEAAYSLIPQELRAEAHLGIGMSMASHTPPDKLEEGIFEIVNQLNRGSHLITSIAERERIAELNLTAGRRAKISTAYASALKYLHAGRRLLTDETWNRNYDLVFSIEHLMAECELLTGDMAAAENRLSMLAERAKTSHDIALVTRLRLTLYTALDRSNRAVEVFIEYQRGCGVDWSPHPTDEEVSREYDQIWSLVGTRQIEDLVDLPLTTDAGLLDVLDVFTEIVTAALFTDEKLLALVICRMVNLSLKHGNSDGSCFAYGWLGRLAGPHFGNYQAGFRFGKLGYELVEKRGLHRYQARAYLCFGLVMPWGRHVKTGREPLRRAFEAADHVGDFTFAACSRSNLSLNLLAAGDPLAEVQREAETAIEFASSVPFGTVIDVITAQLALVRTLQGLTAKFGSFSDGHFDELEFERHLSSNPVLATPECWYCIRKLQARLFAEDYPSAIQASVKAKHLLWTIRSYFEVAEYHFYSALARAGAFDSATEDSRQGHFEALSDHHSHLEIWAKNCPENFENRAALVGAEIARIEGRWLDAEQLYEKAIRSAHGNAFVHNEALAYEIAARFYRARGFDKIADAYLREARHCYAHWGADGKVKQLDQTYPHTKQEPAAPVDASTIVAPVELLDLSTVMKVSQVVSGEIVLEKLIDKLMRAAVEHAGAERALLILPGRDELQIEAEAITSEADVIVHRGETLFTVGLPESVVRYVLRTQENIILDDASSPNPFSADPYIVQRRARSILCLPLINQAKLTGVLYLENNLTPHVFTLDRITVLKVLASQAAISLENAHLYTDLHQAQAYLSEAQRLSRTGSFSWVPSRSELIWSSETYRIFDYDPAIKPNLEMALQRTHPEDRFLAQESIDRASRSGDDWNLDQRLLMPDGSLKYLHVVAHAVKNDSKEASFVGAVMDVTAAKQSQQALEEAFREIKALKDQLQSENIVLREEIDKASMFEQIVGTSPPLRSVLSRVSKVAPTDSTVLITGETGTGKELVARAIHRRSRRASRAFVSVNCAAIPRDLIASELFGHEKGAFTGATQRRLGRFELAEGGTIFLDEVGELPAETQIALLRVLQEREFARVGAAGTIRTDARVIAATNRDLDAAIAAGTFRSDLFYRLNVFPIEMPSLRERREDIPMLVEYFVDRFARQAGKSFQALSKKSLDLLQSYPWPGNIRELQNVIERSVIVCETENFSVDESWLSRQPPATAPGSGLAPFRKLPSQEKEIIEAALTECGGRVYGPDGAATKLGIPRSTLEHKIRSLKINKNHFKAAGAS